MLVSTGPLARLAAGTLAQHLHIDKAEAMARLGEAPSVLAEGLEADKAVRLVELLRSFGLRVRLDKAAFEDELLDLSVQLAVPVRLQRTIRILSEQTGLQKPDIARQLNGPGGLILRGLRRVEMDHYQSVLGRMGNLCLTVSDPASALYDVFLNDGDMTEALADRLRVIGVEADPITGAIAAGLDRELCRHLKNHVTTPDVLVLDRAFQRYDLYLARATGWVTQELADFLVARTGLPRSRFEVLSEHLPLQIETGLTHAAARQFRADYASIGLHTLLVLTGLGETADNA